MAAPRAVTVVVVTWRQRELLPACLTSLARQTLAHDVLVVDNASEDGSAALLARDFPDVPVLRLPTNAGFAGGVAAALGHVQTRFVAVLNDDAQADPQWLAASVELLEARPDLAAVTARMVLDTPDPDGVSRVNNAGVVLLGSGYGADRGLGEPDGPAFDEPVEVFGFSGGAAVLRTLAVKAVGGFRADWFMYYEDTDLAWRLRLAGWSVAYAPGARVRHRHAASSDPASRMFAFHTERNRVLMLLADAPAGFAVACLARFALTTASLGARRLAHHVSGGPVSPALVHDPRLRLQVLRAVLADLPASARRRRTAPRTVARARVLRDWRGTASRPLPGVTPGRSEVGA